MNSRWVAGGLRWRIVWLCGALLSLLLLGVGVWLRIRDNARAERPAYWQSRYESTMEARGKRLRSLGEQLLKALEGDGAAGGFGWLEAKGGRRRLGELEGALLAYRADSLAVWSIPVPSYEGWRAVRDGNYTRINGTWYRVSRIVRGEWQVTMLAGVYREWPVENRYLRAGYVDGLSYLDGQLAPSRILGPGVSVSHTPSQLLAPGNGPTLAGVLMLLGLIFSATWVFGRRHRSLWLSVCTLLAVVVRVAVMRLDILRGAAGDLFQPTLFASSTFIPSLGDLMLHVLVLVFGTWAVIYSCHALCRRRWYPARLSAASLGAVGLLFASDNLLGMLVRNSTLSIPPYVPSVLSGYILTAYLSVTLCFACGILLLAVLVRMGSERPRVAALALVGGWVVWVLVAALWLEWSWMPGTLLLAGMVLLFVLSYRFRGAEGMFRGFELVVALLLALFVSVRMERESQRWDSARRVALARQLASPQDPLLESYLPELYGRIASDSTLFRLQGTARLRYFTSRYQNEFLDGYVVELRESAADSVASAGALLMAPSVAGGGGGRGLMGQSRMPSYLLTVPHAGRVLEAEFAPRRARDGLAYSQLLTDAPRRGSGDSPSYGIAVYNGNQLEWQQGPHSFPLSLGVGVDSVNLASRLAMLGDGEWLTVARDGSRTVVVSRTKTSVFDMLGAVAYAVALFTVALGFILRRGQWIPLQPMIGVGVVRRFQLYTMGLLLGSLGLTLVCALFTFQEDSSARSEAIRRERMTMVSSALQRVEGRRLENRDSVVSLLEEFSQRFNCDINLYGGTGLLVGSSRPGIFTNGIQGERMRGDAWYRLRYLGESRVVSQEHVGEMRFASLYAPLVRGNRVAGYLHIPYPWQGDGSQRQTVILTSLLLDFFMILGVLMLLLSLLVANRAIEPLRRIREGMRSIRLGERYQPLSYETRDAIGELVEAYNEMLGELARSSQELAEHERQEAWRGMARQIAHDIKNPLTPMRLSLQRVARAKQRGDSGWPDLFDRFATQMDAQIDVLASTASSFSSFAQAADAHEVAVEVLRHVEHAFRLFEAYDRIEWRLDLGGIEGVRVRINPTNLVRVIHNLLTNAVQAVESIESPRIGVSGRLEGDWMELRVRDNGVGIPLERQGEVFRINFTTRSAGSGLGLALVSGVVRGAGGQVSFTSRPGEGTEFVLRLPVAKSK